jgi:hypothetical protein
MFEQSATDFAIVRHWSARTHFFNPSCADLIGKSLKGKYPDVNGPSFSGPRLDEITSTTSAVILLNKFTGFDLY